MNRAPLSRSLARALAASMAMALMVSSLSVHADPGDRDRGDRGDRGGHGPQPQHPGERGRWYDGAHGHNHFYPAPGAPVRAVPPGARWVIWGGVNYRFYDGVWYAPGRQGFVVVRPPIGLVVADLPPLATAITIAGIAYLYANGVYYRERPGVGFEVAPPPVEGTPPATGPDRTYVYPRNGQSAQQQASDEYECHRWAVGQTGFDPTAVATTTIVGTAPTPTQRNDYQRARSACLEGRGYTVR